MTKIYEIVSCVLRFELLFVTLLNFLLTIWWYEDKPLRFDSFKAPFHNTGAYYEIQGFSIFGTSTAEDDEWRNIWNVKKVPKEDLKNDLTVAILIGSLPTKRSSLKLLINIRKYRVNHGDSDVDDIVMLVTFLYMLVTFQSVNNINDVTS